MFRSQLVRWKTSVARATTSELCPRERRRCEENARFCRKVAFWACCYLRFCRSWVIFSWNTSSRGNRKILQLAALLPPLPVSLPMQNRCSRPRSWCWWTNSIENTSGCRDLLLPSLRPITGFASPTLYATVRWPTTVRLSNTSASCTGI